MNWLRELMIEMSLPKAFRIGPSSGGDPFDLLLLQLIMVQKAGGAQDSSSGAGAPQSGTPVDEGMIKGLCNSLFRIEANVAQMQAEGSAAKEVRSITSGVSQFKEALTKAGVKMVNPTGQIYDIGRADFEPLGEAQIQEGLRKPLIKICERPAIFIGGRLIQKARGLVVRPPVQGLAQAQNNKSSESLT